MTIRERLNRNKRRLTWMTGLAILLTFVGIFLSPWVGVNGPFLPLIPLASVFLILMYGEASSAFRCTRCQSSLSALIWQRRSNFFAMDPNLRFCPFCGVDLDTAAVGKPSSKTSDLLD